MSPSNNFGHFSFSHYLKKLNHADTVKEREDVILLSDWTLNLTFQGKRSLTLDLFEISNYLALFKILPQKWGIKM